MYYPYVITLIWFPFYRYPVSVQAFFEISLCDYYQCIFVDRLPWSVLFACARVIKGTLKLSLDKLQWSVVSAMAIT